MSRRKKHPYVMTGLDCRIHQIIRQMRRVFRAADGPRLRIAYWRANNIRDRDDWVYRLSADDVIAQRIPARVAGRIAATKVFCKFAAAAGLDCYVVCCADYYDWMDASRGADIKISGRVLMAIMVDGHMRIFDPLAGPHPVWYECTARPGNFVKALRFRLPYMICAILRPDDFAGCDTYRKMQNLYASGDMSNSAFLITPDAV